MLTPGPHAFRLHPLHTALGGTALCGTTLGGTTLGGTTLGGTTLEALRKGVIFRHFYFKFSFGREAGVESLHSPPWPLEVTRTNAYEACLHDFQTCPSETTKVC
ncbi:hypothetical protein A6X21_11940 [Planctopirus hydrillae]|uniref:Uncharacterized protein n=1 Tax=Planctopirus hydrillae TaxID=1841610 RepID=A0A1C3E5A0_9PLAN|nr:hypothetical protein A6X21_11940 [Planctopirus hydrillae]